MRTQDLTPEQRRELLAAWDAAVRAWWSDRDINPDRACYMASLICYAEPDGFAPLRIPEAVAHGA